MRLTYILLCSILYVGCTSSANDKVALESGSLDEPQDSQFVYHIVNPDHGGLRFYWRGDDGNPLHSFSNLRDQATNDGTKLRFAMNGGMYLKDHSPQGLYVEKGKTLRPLNTKKSDYGNFYMAPNGVFCITTDYEAVVCSSEDFTLYHNINYATQSGPLLVIDSTIHPKFTLGSKNVHIRNGVGILPNGNVIFAISKEQVNFYDFASFFLDRGCKNALYLDGFVSRLYLPEKGIKQMEGKFGVLIAEVE
jgi:uncharacterized protein YigE (DUF2233 family)